MNKRLWLSLWGACALLMLLIAVKSRNLRRQSQEYTQELTVFHAEQLSVLFSELSESFMFEFPDITVYTESVSDPGFAQKLHKNQGVCDIFGSTDQQIIKDLLVRGLVEFNIRFAACNKHMDDTQQEIVCSVCMPKNAGHRHALQAWLRYLFSEDGRAILKKNDFVCLSPLVIDGNAPDFLKNSK